MNGILYLSMVVLTVWNLGCLSNIGEKDGIAEVEIASIPYYIETVIPIRADEVFHYDGVVLYRLANRDSLEYIQQRVGSAAPLEEGYHCDDSRLVCLLRHAKGEVDTLTFSNMYMSFNGTCYPMDTTLIRFVAARLPQQHRDAVEDYIIRAMRNDPFRRE